MEIIIEDYNKNFETPNYMLGDTCIDWRPCLKNPGKWIVDKICPLAADFDNEVKNLFMLNG